MNNPETIKTHKTVYDPTEQHATAVDNHNDSHEEVHGADTSHKHDETDQLTHDEDE
jgi:hypothetical protein